MIRCVCAAWSMFCQDNSEVIIRTFHSIDASLTSMGHLTAKYPTKGHRPPTWCPL